MKSRGRLTRHASNSHCCPSSEDPPQAFDLALAVAVERDGDFVVELLDGAVASLLLHAHVHAAVVEHAAQIIFQVERFLRRFLR